jgi:SecD/SecF fusion protein
MGGYSLSRRGIPDAGSEGPINRGGSAVENFAVPMMFGVVVATTSSIFIAAPILLLLGDWWKHRHEREATTSGTLVKA